MCVSNLTRGTVCKSTVHVSILPYTAEFTYRHAVLKEDHVPPFLGKVFSMLYWGYGKSFTIVLSITYYFTLECGRRVLADVSVGGGGVRCIHFTRLMADGRFFAHPQQLTWLRGFAHLALRLNLSLSRYSWIFWIILLPHDGGSQTRQHRLMATTRIERGQRNWRRHKSWSSGEPRRRKWRHGDPSCVDAQVQRKFCAWAEVIRGGWR